MSRLLETAIATRLEGHGSRGIVSRPLVALASALCAALIAAACGNPSTPTLEIATTTSVQNSGLLERLLPAFAAATVRAHAAGSGRALEMMADGTVPLIISHAPEAEAQSLRSHSDWEYRKIAFNHFIIVGPPNDPAKVRLAPDAVTAFRRIAASRAFFVSRGDRSGTHEREQALWKAAAVTIDPERYIVSGSTMSRALRHANEEHGYTLTDEATFWQLEKDVELTPLFRGDPLLLNTYAVIYLRGHATATAFAEWVIAGQGRTLIGDYRIEGRPAFTPWPNGCPGGAPIAQPCS